MINIHLISDSTAQTVEHMNNAIMSKFNNIQYKVFLWPLINKKIRIKSLIKHIKEKPGIVLYTIYNNELSETLEKEIKLITGCEIINGLNHLIWEYSKILKINPNEQKNLFINNINNEYFQKIDAINFCYEYDDGQKIDNLEKADIIILGVSRTSKTPTSHYLATKGFKVANIPYVHCNKNYNSNILNIVTNLQKSIIFGLTIDPKRLIDIRRSRFMYIKENKNFDYINEDKIKEEINEYRKFLQQINCPIIDVTQRSIEETASIIIRIYNNRKI